MHLTFFSFIFLTGSKNQFQNYKGVSDLKAYLDISYHYARICEKTQPDFLKFGFEQ